jgi:hypothetical protein
MRPTPTFERCPWARKGTACYVRRCPLNNRKFRTELDKWALVGRTPRALNPEPSPGGGYDSEMAMLRKCRIARLFEDDQLVLDWIDRGKMTKFVCAELVRGERKYRDMIREERYGQ